MCPNSPREGPEGQRRQAAGPGWVGVAGFLWVCEQQGGSAVGPLPARPPMLLFFNKTRVDGTGLLCVLEAPLPGT